jgi:hypothetical protein
MGLQIQGCLQDRPKYNPTSLDLLRKSWFDLQIRVVQPSDQTHPQPKPTPMPIHLLQHPEYLLGPTPAPDGLGPLQPTNHMLHHDPYTRKCPVFYLLLFRQLLLPPSLVRCSALCMQFFDPLIAAITQQFCLWLCPSFASLEHPHVMPSPFAIRG